MNHNFRRVFHTSQSSIEEGGLQFYSGSSLDRLSVFHAQNDPQSIQKGHLQNSRLLDPSSRTVEAQVTKIVPAHPRNWKNKHYKLV